MLTATQVRARRALRASHVVWIMGATAAIGALVGTAQIWAREHLDLEGLPQVVSLDEVGDVSMTIGDLSIWVRALSAAPGIVTAAALAAAAFLLSPILLWIAAGAPFRVETERNLLKISRILVGGAIAAMLLEVAAIWQISVAVDAFEAAAQASGAEYTVVYGTQVTTSLLPLALGIVAATFRWVIRDGVTLEKEAEGVI